MTAMYIGEEIKLSVQSKCKLWIFCVDTRCACDERGSVANTQCDSSEQCQCKVRLQHHSKTALRSDESKFPILEPYQCKINQCRALRVSLGPR